MWYYREQLLPKRMALLLIRLAGSSGFARRLIRRGEARVDWEITQQLAKQLGGEMNYRFAGEIALAIAENVPGYADATHQNIGDAGIKLAVSGQ